VQFNKNTVSFIIIFGTLSFAVTYAVPRCAARKIGGRYRCVLPASPTPPQPCRGEEAVKCFAGCGRRRCSTAGLRVVGDWRIFAEPNSGRESERWCGRRVSFITVNERRWFTHEYSGQCRRRSVHRRRSRWNEAPAAHADTRSSSSFSVQLSRPLRRTLIRFVLTGCDTAVQMESDAGNLSYQTIPVCYLHAKVTAGLVESNGSLPPGLWLMSPVGLPRTRISSGTLHSVIKYRLAFTFTRVNATPRKIMRNTKQSRCPKKRVADCWWLNCWL